MPRPLLMFLCVILLFQARFSSANEIEEVLPGGLLARADYTQGEDGKPAILLLHGFLTVHNFNLIRNIADEISGNQYSVLTPTLTLGISKRRSSLDCNALHLHNMESDIKEIEWWVNWLINKGHKNIILIGHSSGAVQVLSYANTYKHKEIAKLIALSLIPLNDKNNNQFQASTKIASQMISNKNNEIRNFTLAYCLDNYIAPAKDFMSYAEWDYPRILESLKDTALKKKIIMGGDDIPVYTGWIADLRNTGATVDVLKGADHFFGSGTEFELYDSILRELKAQ